MAITGISSIDNKQIIAAGALSAISANQALVTSGGDSLQGLYDTVSTNSGSWTGGGGSYPSNITADSVTLSAEYIPGDSDVIKVDITPYSVALTHPADGYADVNVTAVQSWDSTYETVRDNSGSWTGGGGGSVPDEVMSAASAVSANSANWNEISAYQQDSASYVIGPNINVGEVNAEKITLTGGEMTISVVSSLTGDSELGGVYIGTGGITLRNDIDGNQDINITEVAKWNETTDTLSANSANWNEVSAYQQNSGSYLAVGEYGQVTTTADLYISGEYTSAYYDSDHITFYSGSNGTPEKISMANVDDFINWNSTYETVSSNSANWSAAYYRVNNLSGNWNSTVSTVASNSGSWGGTNLPISAGAGISLSIVDNVLVISTAGV